MVETMGASLMGGQVFELETDYQQRTAFTMGTLLLFAAQDWDRSAARLVEENAALRALFADAARQLEGTLASRLAEAAASEDPSLVVTELQKANAVMRSLLIDLHVHVEERDDEIGRALNARIWQELVASTDRRQLPGAPF
jgi:hypothetical protein